MLCLGDMFRLKLKALIEQYENTLRETEHTYSMIKLQVTELSTLEHAVCIVEAHGRLT